jgi:hypothetical protein
MHIGAGGCAYLAGSPNPDCLASQALSRSVPLCCFENRDLQLRASNRPSTMRHTSLLTTQPAVPLKSGRFSPLQVRGHTELFQDLPPRPCWKEKQEGWPCGLYRKVPERNRRLGCRVFTTLGKQASVRSTDLYSYTGIDSRQGEEIFSLLHSVQTDSGANPDSYTMGTGESFPGGLSGRGVRLTSPLHRVSRSRMAELYIHSPIYLHDILLN